MASSTRTLPPGNASIFLGLPSVFLTLNAKASRLLADEALFHVAKKNASIVSYHAPNPGAYIAKSGVYGATAPSLTEEPLVLDLYKAGALILPALASESASIFEIVCICPGAYLEWPLDVFKSAVEADGSLGEWVLQQTFNKKQEMYLRKMRQYHFSLEALLASALWELSEPFDEGHRLVKEKVPQGVLASYLGMTREELNRRKSLLERAGYLEVVSQGLLLRTEVSTLFAQLHGSPAPWEN